MALNGYKNPVQLNDHTRDAINAYNSTRRQAIIRNPFFSNRGVSGVQSVQSQANALSQSTRPASSRRHRSRPSGRAVGHRSIPGIKQIWNPSDFWVVGAGMPSLEQEQEHNADQHEHGTSHSDLKRAAMAEDVDHDLDAILGEECGDLISTESTQSLPPTTTNNESTSTSTTNTTSNTTTNPTASSSTSCGPFSCHKRRVKRRRPPSPNPLTTTSSSKNTVIDIEAMEPPPKRRKTSDHSSSSLRSHALSLPSSSSSSSVSSPSNSSSNSSSSSSSQSAKGVLTVLRNVILKAMLKGGESHSLRIKEVERKLYQKLLIDPKYAEFRSQLPPTTEALVDGMVADHLVVRHGDDIRIHPSCDIKALHRRLNPLSSPSQSTSSGVSASSSSGPSPQSPSSDSTQSLQSAPQQRERMNADHDDDDDDGGNNNNNSNQQTQHTLTLIVEDQRGISIDGEHSEQIGNGIDGIDLAEDGNLESLLSNFSTRILSRWRRKEDCIRSELQREKERRTALQSERDELTANLKRKQCDEEKKAMDKDLERVRLAESQKERDRLQQSIDALNAQKVETEQKRDELLQRLKRMDVQREEMETKMKGLRSDLVSKTKDADQLQREVEALKENNKELMTQNETISERVKKMEEEQAKYDMFCDDDMKAIEAMEEEEAIEALCLEEEEEEEAEPSIDDLSFEKDANDSNANRITKVLEDDDRLKVLKRRALRLQEKLKEQGLQSQSQSKSLSKSLKDEERKRLEMKAEYDERIEGLKNAVRKYKAKSKHHKEEARRLKDEMARMREMDWRGKIIREYVDSDGNTLYDMEWDISTGMKKEDLSQDDLTAWNKRKKEKQKEKKKRKRKDDAKLLNAEQPTSL